MTAPGLQRGGFELTALAVIGTDCTDSSKSNHENDGSWKHLFGQCINYGFAINCMHLHANYF